MQRKIQVMISIICMMIIFVAVCVVLASNAKAYEGDPIRTKKQEALHEAADILRACGYAEDSTVIQALQSAWWQEKEDLDIVAKVIQNEADPAWCEWEHSVAVGAVVTNRVASPYFPNTVKEVVAQPGQYLESYTYGFDNTSRIAYEAAKAAMDGDHNVPENAFWQDTHVQGAYIWKAFLLDTGWYRSTTYICCGIAG